MNMSRICLRMNWCKRGVVFVQADAPWASFAVEDRRVITGQNPASGGAVADLLIQAIGRP